MGAGRMTLGIIFTHNENWIGGTYYILNLVSSMTHLPEERKPRLKVFCWKDSEFEQISRTGYPYLEKCLLPASGLVEKVANGLGRKVLGRNLVGQRFAADTVDALFPATFAAVFDNISRKVFWIQDFQEFHLPELFPASTLTRRDKVRRRLAMGDNEIVLSSEDAHNDYQQMFPGSRARVHVLPFAVTHPDYGTLSITALREKFNLPEQYFFSPNQFWQHKNQFAILKAVKELKEEYPEVVVAFTGKMQDSRNPEYIPSLEKFVEDHGLQHNIRFLGFIDRKDQLGLMNHAAAVIQPSRFEGWSTVVEDAKAMNQVIFASNLGVHKEQLGDKAYFFSPLQPAELAELMRRLLNEPGAFPRPEFHYDRRVRAFGENFISIMERVVGK
ncbi:glycosyltransferase family 4 protein [Neolewinella agarilytica]|uniref:Glycosyl transferases group 1 n=1 Tax=Neolewinella agarilytica TaxID=478744 RepID=A0A1H9DYC3_9BACT|nr:glycosyltransferase family 1 protein [Neolewinella agarilytica]SEQ18471.1 Glycosyl transferases group 1 [Neolewinella agarilytica]